jgi:hypothetical protein
MHTTMLSYNLESFVVVEIAGGLNAQIRLGWLGCLRGQLACRICYVVIELAHLSAPAFAAGEMTTRASA